jgi:alkylation response protein AidB-like acyl-CoA dehydrogenase
MVCKLEAMRSLVARAAASGGEDGGEIALIAKVVASEDAETVCRDAQRIVGSSSLMAMNPLSALQQDARGVGLMGPPNDVCRGLVTARLFEEIR